MNKLTVITNLPSLRVDVFKGNEVVTFKACGDSPIPNFQGEERTEQIVIPLAKGIYSVRLSLPYFSGSDVNEPGVYFPMPVVMDKHIAFRGDEEEKELTFKAQLG